LGGAREGSRPPFAAEPSSTTDAIRAPTPSEPPPDVASAPLPDVASAPPARQERGAAPEPAPPALSAAREESAPPPLAAAAEEAREPAPEPVPAREQAAPGGAEQAESPRPLAAREPEDEGEQRAEPLSSEAGSPLTVVREEWGAPRILSVEPAAGR
jgi:hypothetical protein